MIQKSTNNKTKNDNCGFKTERENSKRKNFNEINSKKKIETLALPSNDNNKTTKFLI